MLDVIEKLLILQDRDRKLIRLRSELARLAPQRQQFDASSTRTREELDAAKTRVMQLESKRKDLEIEVETKKQQIDKYALQQYQTKKNEEYRALSHEIENTKVAISKVEDQILDVMESTETAQKLVAQAMQNANNTRKMVEEQIATMDEREQNLKKELAELETNRGALAAAVDEAALGRYERLLKQKGENAIVGVEHGVCGGCHMRLNRQVVVTCQAQAEITTCPNCGRILYFTSDMDVIVTD